MVHLNGVIGGFVQPVVGLVRVVETIGTWRKQVERLVEEQRRVPAGITGVVVKEHCAPVDGLRERGDLCHVTQIVIQHPGLQF